YLTLTPSPRKSPSPGKNSWSGALPVWLQPTLAPWPTLPLPSGQTAAMSSAWWWELTNGPSRQEVTSPAATAVLGPRMVLVTLACRSAWECSVSTARSTTASVATRLPHCSSDRVTQAPDSTRAGSSGSPSRVLSATAVAPSTRAFGPTYVLRTSGVLRTTA